MRVCVIDAGLKNVCYHILIKANQAKQPRISRLLFFVIFIIFIYNNSTEIIYHTLIINKKEELDWNMYVRVSLLELEELI